jgi:hypothetical protein
MNASQLTTAIIQGTFTNDELQSIIDAVKYARNKLGNQTKRTLTVGAKVRFISSRSGQIIIGTVRKLAIKNIVVDTPLGAYRVPANMLEAA